MVDGLLGGQMAPIGRVVEGSQKGVEDLLWELEGPQRGVDGLQREFEGPLGGGQVPFGGSEIR